ncbi:MAG: alkaline phosphatase family protein [Planctomycetota bacterium]
MIDLPATLAYIGPGAGIALAWSVVMLVVSVLLGLLALAATPLLWLLAAWRRLRRTRRTGPWRRIVVLGFDGMDPRLCERWMADGTLPELARLRDDGSFTRLGTTFPAISPAAWASFSTGVRPSKHAVFDFIALDRATYLPELSSARVLPPRRRVALGKWWFTLPGSRANVVQLRRALPWWVLLGRRGWPSTVLRVPITFPPDRTPFGRQLSGMCLPDLRGSQGTYTLFSTEADGGTAEANDVGNLRSAFGAGSGKPGGEVVALGRDALGGKAVRVEMSGPPDPSRRDGRRTAARLTLQLDVKRDRLLARFDGDAGEWLQRGVYSSWMTVRLQTALGSAFSGCCRLLWLDESHDHAPPVLRVYATPLMIDPLAPVLPVSHPQVFAPYLAASHGRFATLGLAEDTTALDDGVLTPQQFLDQCWLIQAEREAALTDALQHTRDGVVVAVFDGTDRIQHMFWNEPGNAPAHDAADVATRDADGLPSAESVTTHSPTIRDTYRRFDQLVGRVRKEMLRGDDLLWVISDHGFTGFARQVDLNRWLLDAGYLVLRDGPDGVEPGAVRWLDGIDWSRTRAFALGLAGVHLNVAGRDRHGIVAESDVPALRREISDALCALRDAGADHARPVRCAIPPPAGPFVDRGPDLLIGWSHGYRISWTSVRGGISPEVISANPRRWSGDHGVDPELVPGVWFSSVPIVPAAERGPHIVDFAPTLLAQFGVQPAPQMDGRVVSFVSTAKHQQEPRP